MKIFDRYQNEVQQGDSLSWQLPNGQQILTEVTVVESGGILIAGEGKQCTLARLVIQHEIVIPWDEKPAMLGDMTKTFNPKSKQILEAILSRG